MYTVHSGQYKLRLKNESGVFESVALVCIEGLPGRKKKEEHNTEEGKVSSITR